MKQVRVPVYAPAGMPAWVAKVAHRAPRVAAAVIGAWTLALVGSVAWLQNRVEVPASLLVARYLSNVEELLLAAALKVAAVLHVSGFADWWSQTTGSVPGLGVAGALALMVGISGLAIWTLYRVTGYQPGRVEHA